LDGTLAPSKSSIDGEMAQLLSNLLDLIKVGIISGGTWSQFTDQVINHLPDSDNFPNLSLLPTCGTKFYRYLNKEWKLIYSEDFDPDERQRPWRSQVTTLKKHGVM
jgi:hydroxymethylpyrimidine pyrophosphatase-like HAD family hydrolase